MDGLRRLIGPKPCMSLSVLALVAGLVLVAPGAAAARSGPTQLTSCSFSALQTAMSGGGTIDYEQDCYNSSRVVFPNEISFKGTADIEANGYTIVFYGSNSTRFFELVGGQLTISDIDLYGGGAALVPGKYLATATYSGDAELASSRAAPIAFSVTKARTKTAG
jgi:hypothetical protein